MVLKIDAVSDNEEEKRNIKREEEGTRKNPPKNKGDLIIDRSLMLRQAAIKAKLAGVDGNFSEEVHEPFDVGMITICLMNTAKSEMCDAKDVREVAS